MTSSTQNPNVRFTRSSRLKDIELRFSQYREHAFDKHSHRTYSIGVVNGGQTDFFHHSITETIQRGDIALINTNEVHACNPVEGHALTYYMLYIQPNLMCDIAAELTESQSQPPHFPTPIVQDAPMHSKLVELCQVIETGQDDLEAEIMLYETLLEVIRKYAAFDTPLPAQTTKSSENIAAAHQYLMDHLFEKISLEELGAHSGLSPYHFLREFRKHYGMPPHTYQLQQRINEAKRLLANGTSIADTAAQVGFADQSHFTRKFKTLVGTTPRQYQDAKE